VVGAADGGAMISVQIKKRLGDFALDVGFEAPRGVTAIFGRSGSGKTSVINAIAGLMRPDAGRIVVDGRDLTAVPVHKRNLGVVFQDARLFPHMTVAKNLAYGGAHDSDKIVELLGLGALMNRFPKALSGGEKSRVALGRALMSKPALLLLDEPLAALDAPRKTEILSYLERLRDEMDVPMIYVSHDMSEVARLATTIVIMEAGRVVRAGPMGAVLAHPEAVGLLGARDAGAVLAATVVNHDEAGGLTRLSFDGGDIVLPKVLGAVGQNVRLRIPAQDVILAVERPKGISARNILPVTITALDEAGTGLAVGLQAGASPLLARITTASAHEMHLKVGMEIYAIIKATAVSPEA